MSNAITLDSLIAKLQEELDEIDLSGLKPETEFRKIEGWNSLYGLIIMALLSTEYDIELEASQIQAIHTVEDLYQTIKKHTG
jgi:acyl carrier protein